MCRKVEPSSINSLQFIHSAFSRVQLSRQDKISQSSRRILDHWGERAVTYLRLQQEETRSDILAAVPTKQTQVTMH